MHYQDVAGADAGEVGGGGVEAGVVVGEEAGPHNNIIILFELPVLAGGEAAVGGAEEV